MGLLLQLGWLDVGYVIGARQLAWTRQLAWARLLPGAIKNRGQGGIVAFIRLGSAGGQGVGVCSHWGTSGILAWQTLRTFLLGWGGLAGKQS
jgi:hypothetical protein